MKYVAYAVLGIVGILAVSFGLNSLGMVQYSFFGTWKEQIRTDIQRESFAYKDGMAKNLQQMANDYASADSEGKQMILSGVRAQYGTIDTAEYPAHLRDFLAKAGVR